MRDFQYKTGVSLFGILGFLLVGCQGDEAARLKERASIESAESAQQQIEAEKKYQEERSLEMENDLSQRQRFYQAVSGIYEGSGKHGTPDGGGYTVRLIISSTLPPYKSDRIRTPEEVASDLNNLYLSIQTVMWTAEGIENSGKVSWGCVYEKIRPDLTTGIIHLMSAECKTSFVLYLSDGTDMPDSRQHSEMKATSEEISRHILVGALDSVYAFKGFRQANGAAAQIRFAVQKQ